MNDLAVTLADSVSYTAESCKMLSINNKDQLVMYTVANGNYPCPQAPPLNMTTIFFSP